MRKAQTALLIVLLLGACQKSASASKSKTPIQEVEISKFDEEMLQAMPRGDYKDQIRKNLKDAAICIKKYRAKTPEYDAKVSAARRDLRLFSAEYNGFSAGNETVGISNCSFQGMQDTKKFIDLNNPEFGDGQHFETIDLCDNLMVKYATAYNTTIARIAPEALIHDCKGSPPDRGHW